MNILLIFINAYILCCACAHAADNMSTTIDCRVYSAYFRLYMYAKYKLPAWSRQIAMWQEDQTVFRTYFGEQDPSGVWYFEPVDERNNTYYVRNMKYADEYLRSSNAYEEWFFKKRNIIMYTDPMRNRSDEMFMWRLERVPHQDNDVFHVWNVKLNLPIYAYFSSGSKRNKVYDQTVSVSISISKPYGDKYHWLLKCRNNKLPQIV